MSAPRTLLHHLPSELIWHILEWIPPYIVFRKLSLLSRALRKTIVGRPVNVGVQVVNHPYTDGINPTEYWSPLRKICASPNAKNGVTWNVDGSGWPVHQWHSHLLTSLAQLLVPPWTIGITTIQLLIHKSPNPGSTQELDHLALAAPHLVDSFHVGIIIPDFCTDPPLSEHTNDEDNTNNDADNAVEDIDDSQSETNSNDTSSESTTHSTSSFDTMPSPPSPWLGNSDPTQPQLWSLVWPNIHHLVLCYRTDRTIPPLALSTMFPSLQDCNILFDRVQDAITLLRTLPVTVTRLSLTDFQTFHMEPPYSLILQELALLCAAQDHLTISLQQLEVTAADLHHITPALGAHLSCISVRWTTWADLETLRVGSPYHIAAQTFAVYLECYGGTKRIEEFGREAGKVFAGAFPKARNIWYLTVRGAGEMECVVRSGFAEGVGKVEVAPKYEC